MCNDMKKLTFTLFHITLFTRLRQTDRRIQKDRHRQTDGQTDRKKKQTNRQIDRERHFYIYFNIEFLQLH